MDDPRRSSFEGRKQSVVSGLPGLPGLPNFKTMQKRRFTTAGTAENLLSATQLKDLKKMFDITKSKYKK